MKEANGNATAIERRRYVVARRGRKVTTGDLAALVVRLWDLTQTSQAPGWINGAGRELLRDYGVQVIED
jgi:hypothetical protein